MKPGIKTIVAGAVLFVAGACVIPLLIVLPLLLGNSHPLQFKAPGDVEYTANEPGRYYLWNDFRTVFDGRSYNQSEELPDGMEIRIQDVEGRPLPFVSNTSISSSRNGNAYRRSVGYVEVGGPGKLEIRISGGDEERIFSFSRSVLLKVLGSIAGGLVLSMLAGTAGFGLIVWGVVKLVRRTGTAGAVG